MVDVQVTFEFSADLWPLEVDASELKLVVFNLAVNARDVIPDGGEARFSSAPRTYFVSFSVFDNGSGMPPVGVRVVEDEADPTDVIEPADSSC